MLFELFVNTMVLFALGIVGWRIANVLKVPMAPLLGAVLVIGFLRIVQVDLPASPAYLFPALQMLLGISIGANVNRETVRQLKTIVTPCLIIAVWSLSTAFGMGYALKACTSLDIYTAILSGSIGGLPEMTIIALDVKADTQVVVFVQSSRLFVTVLIFPFIIRMSVVRGRKNDETKGVLARVSPGVEESSPKEIHYLHSSCPAIRMNFCSTLAVLIQSVPRSLLTFFFVLFSSLLFSRLGIPAGIMLGSLLATSLASLAGVKVLSIPPHLIKVVLVGLGIVISDNVTYVALETFAFGDLLLPMIIITLFTLFTSLLASYLIHKFVGWDYPTCFLATAPGGLSAMTALAIFYNKDIIRVSFLHLCRLLTLNITISVYFKFLC